MPVVKRDFEPGDLVWFRFYIGQASRDELGLVIARSRNYAGPYYIVLCEGRLESTVRSALRATPPDIEPGERRAATGA